MLPLHGPAGSWRGGNLIIAAVGLSVSVGLGLSFRVRTIDGRRRRIAENNEGSKLGEESFDNNSIPAIACEERNDDGAQDADRAHGTKTSLSDEVEVGKTETKEEVNGCATSEPRLEVAIPGTNTRMRNDDDIHYEYGEVDESDNEECDVADDDIDDEFVISHDAKSVEVTETMSTSSFASLSGEQDVPCNWTASPPSLMADALAPKRGKHEEVFNSGDVSTVESIIDQIRLMDENHSSKLDQLSRNHETQIESVRQSVEKRCKEQITKLSSKNMEEHRKRKRLEDEVAQEKCKREKMETELVGELERLRALLQNREHEVSKLEILTAERSQHVDSLQEDVKLISSERDEIKVQHCALRNRVKGLTDELSACRDECCTMLSKLETSEQMQGALCSESTSLKTELSRERQMITELQGLKDGLESRVSSLTQTVVALEHQVMEEKSSGEKKLSAYKVKTLRELEDANARVAEAHTAREETKQELESCRALQAGMEAKMDEIEGLKTSLESQVLQLTQTVNSLESEITEEKKRGESDMHVYTVKSIRALEDANARAAAAAAAREETEQDLDKCRKLLADVQEKLKNTEHELADRLQQYTKRITFLEEEVDDAKANLTTMEQEREQLTREHTSEIESLRASMEKRRKNEIRELSMKNAESMHQAEQERKCLKLELAQEKSERKEMEGELKCEIEQLRAVSDERKEMEEELKCEIEQLRAVSDERKDDVATLEQSTSELSKEVVTLRRDLKSVASERDDIKSQFNSLRNRVQNVANELDECRVECQSLSSKLESSHRVQDALCSENNTLKIDISRERKVNADMEALNDKLESRVSELTQTIATLECRMKDEKENAETILHAYKAKSLGALEDERARTAAAQVARDETQQELKCCKALQTEMEERMNNMTTLKDKLENQVSKLTGSVESLEFDVKEEQKRGERKLQSCMAKSLRDIDDAKACAVVASAAHEETQRELHRCRVLEADLAERLKITEGLRDELECRVSELTQVVTSLECELKEEHDRGESELRAYKAKTCLDLQEAEARAAASIAAHEKSEKALLSGRAFQADIQAKMSDMEAVKNALETRVKNLTQTVNTLESQIDEDKTQMECKLRACEAKSSCDLREAEARRDEAHALCKEKDVELDNYKLFQADLQARLNDVVGLNSELESQVSELKESVMNLKCEISEEKQRRERDLNTCKSVSSREIEEAEGRAAAANAARQEVEEEVVSLKKLVGDMQVNMRNVKCLKHEMEGRILELSQTVTTLERQIVDEKKRGEIDLQTCRAKSKHDLEDAEARVAKADTARKKTEDDLTGCRDLLAAMQERLNEAEDGKVELQNQMSKLTQTLKSLERQLADEKNRGESNLNRYKAESQREIEDAVACATAARAAHEETEKELKSCRVFQADMQKRMEGMQNEFANQKLSYTDRIKTMEEEMHETMANLISTEEQVDQLATEHQIEIDDLRQSLEEQRGEEVAKIFSEMAEQRRQSEEKRKRLEAEILQERSNRERKVNELNGDIVKLRTSLQVREEEVAKLENIKSACAKDIDALQHEVKDVSSERAAMKSDYDSLKQRAKGLAMELKERRVECRSLSRKVEECEKMREEKCAESESLRTDLSREREAIAKLNGVKDNLETQRSDLTNALKSLEREMMAAKKCFEEKLDTQSAESLRALEDANSRLAEAHASGEGMKKELRSCGVLQAEMQERLICSEKELANRSRSYADRIKILEEEVGNLRTNLKTAQENCDQLTREHKVEIDRFMQSVSERLEEEKEELNGKNAEERRIAEKERKRFNDEIAQEKSKRKEDEMELEGKLEELQQQLQTREDEVTKLKNTTLKRSKEVDTLREEMKQLSSERDESKFHYDELKERVQAIDNELKESRVECQMLSRNLDSCEKENETISSKIKSIEMDLVWERKACSELKVRNDALENRISELTNSIATLECRTNEERKVGESKLLNYKSKSLRALKDANARVAEANAAREETELELDNCRTIQADMETKLNDMENELTHQLRTYTARIKSLEEEVDLLRTDLAYSTEDHDELMRKKDVEIEDLKKEIEVLELSSKKSMGKLCEEEVEEEVDAERKSLEDEEVAGGKSEREERQNDLSSKIEQLCTLLKNREDEVTRLEDTLSENSSKAVVVVDSLKEADLQHNISGEEGDEIQAQYDALRELAKNVSTRLEERRVKCRRLILISSSELVNSEEDDNDENVLLQEMRMEINKFKDGLSRECNIIETIESQKKKLDKRVAEIKQTVTIITEEEGKKESGTIHLLHTYKSKSERALNEVSTPAAAAHAAIEETEHEMDICRVLEADMQTKLHTMENELADRYRIKSLEEEVGKLRTNLSDNLKLLDDKTEYIEKTQIERKNMEREMINVQNELERCKSTLGENEKMESNVRLMKELNSKYENEFLALKNELALLKKKKKKYEEELAIKSTVPGESHDNDDGCRERDIFSDSSQKEETEELHMAKMEISRLVNLLGDLESDKMEALEELNELKQKLMKETETVVAAAAAEEEEEASSVPVSVHHDESSSPSDSCNKVVAVDDSDASTKGGKVVLVDKKDNDKASSSSDADVDAVDLEYVKNVVLRYMCARSMNEQRMLLPVLSTTLLMTQEEESWVDEAIDMTGGLQGVGNALFESLGNLAVGSSVVGEGGTNAKQRGGGRDGGGSEGKGLSSYFFG